ncbi:MAG: ClbS/DfsB family four-helix bundle protein [Chloroflexi bacterium]|nr:ClbS/DfsB family four-helix bundle protein [Chloroflexota bacterium]
MIYLENILDKLDRSRERLLVALEMLPDEALLRPNVVGELSITDCLALQTAWEAELVTGFMRIDKGQKPEHLLQALAQPADYDQQRLIENRARDLDAIFHDFQHVRVQVEEWLEEFSEKSLMSPQRYAWLNGRSLAQLTAALTYEREATYIPAIAAFAADWAAQWDEAYPEPAPELLIPLTAVSLEENSHDYDANEPE